MIGALMEESAFKTQWVGNNIFLGLLGFLRQPNLRLTKVCLVGWVEVTLAQPWRRQ